MRIALLHNASAGCEDHSETELRALIRRAGHEVVHLVTRVADLTAALQQAPCELVVVAGGDGTVSRAACELAGWQVPLSILPLGTANNTAAALNLLCESKPLARSWHEAGQVSFDLGLLSDGTLRRRFAEAAGWGVFSSTIAEAKRNKAGKNVDETLKRDRKLFRSIARQASPREYRVTIDGRDISGEYLLVEAMNVPLLGPRLKISAQSDPSDGVFELVLADESHREPLEELARTGELANSPAWRIERGSQFRIETSDAVMHCDGRLWRHAPGRHQFEISVESRAIRYLR